MKTLNFFLRPLIVFLLLLSSVALLAQSGTEDIVYLKNGSIIRGKIIEQKDSDFLRIQIEGGTIFQFSWQEIDKIETGVAKINSEKDKKEIKYRTKGYFNDTELALLMGERFSQWSPGISTAFSFSTVNGYRFNRFLKTGGGIGLDIYNFEGLMLMPVFLRVSGDLLKLPVSPFYVLDAGYSFLLSESEENSKGGIMLNPAFGIKINSASGNAFIIKGGYRFQKAQEEVIMWNDNRLLNQYEFSRVVIGIGFHF